MVLRSLCKLGILVLLLADVSLVIGEDIWDTGIHVHHHNHHKWDVHNTTNATHVWNHTHDAHELHTLAQSVRNQSKILKAIQNQMNITRHAVGGKLTLLENLIRANTLAIRQLAEGTAAPNHTEPKTECPVSFKKFNASCYFIGFMPVPRPKAKRICETMNSYLVEVDNYVEDQYLISELLDPEGRASFSPRGFHTGLTDHRREGNWVWETSGRPLGYRNWFGREGRRKYSNREDYMVYWRESNFLWHDWMESEPAGFICEHNL